MATTPAMAIDKKQLLCGRRDVVEAFYTFRGDITDVCAPYAGFSVCDYTGGNPATVEECRRELAAQLGIDLEHLMIPRQTHSLNVALVDAATQSDELDEIDALVTMQRGVALCVNTADCVPVVVCAPDLPMVAAIHSGWRGAEGNIVGRTVAVMAGLGAEPAAMIAALGPSICPDCFEVGEEVASRFDKRFVAQVAGSKPHVDLRAVVMAQLVDAGLDEGNIEFDGACSRCGHSKLFSARRLGVASGRTATVVMLR